MTARRASLLALACLALGPASAHAATKTVSADATLADGPVLAGGRAVWMDGTRGTVRVLAGSAGRVPETWLSARFVDYEDEDTGEYGQATAHAFAASSSFVLLSSTSRSGTYKYMQHTAGARVEAHPIGPGASHTVGFCSTHVDSFGGQLPPPRVPDPLQMAVDGATAVGGGCDSGPRVIDVRTGDELRRLPSLGDSPRIAGRYVASRTGSEVIVYDWQAGQEAYRAQLPAGASPAVFDLATDGTVASVQFTARENCATGQLRFHSAADPAGRVSPVAPCRAHVAIDGSRVAIVAREDSAAVRFVIAEVAADGTRRELARLGTQELVGDLDYVAGEVAYAKRGCNGHLNVLLSDAGPGVRGVECLGLDVSSGSRVRGRTLRVRGHAASAARGRLHVRFRLRVAGKRREVRTTIPLADGEFDARVRLPRWVRSPRAARSGNLLVTFRGNDEFAADSEAARVRVG